MEGVTLDTLGHGALNELFAAELARVLANIADPNTDDKVKRVITIQVKFKPNRERDSAAIELVCGSKLAGIMTVETKVYMGKVKGALVAVEHDPRQSGLFDQERSALAAVAQFSKKDGE